MVDCFALHSARYVRYNGQWNVAILLPSNETIEYPKLNSAFLRSSG